MAAQLASISVRAMILLSLDKATDIHCESVFYGQGVKMFCVDGVVFECNRWLMNIHNEERRAHKSNKVVRLNN